MSSQLSLLLLLSLSIFPLSSLSPAIDNSIFAGCTQLRYNPNSTYHSNLNSLLTSMVNSATYSSYNNYTIQGSSPQDTLYGLYQCRADLSLSNCSTCIAAAVTQINVLCSDNCGGTLQLEGCYLKYDNNTFVGVEDKTVVLKKCGASVGLEAEVEAMARRDAVLAALVGSSGGYRVEGSGKVKGVAQCVGDLSASDCQDCVGEAIGRLKSDCVTSDSGDMFLVKCYARYSIDGTPQFSIEQDPDRSGRDKCNIDGEKRIEIEIIIGVTVAGVSFVLILAVVLIRKRMSEVKEVKQPEISRVTLGAEAIIPIKMNVTPSMLVDLDRERKRVDDENLC